MFKGSVRRHLHDSPAFEAQGMTLPQIGERTAAFPSCAEADGNGGALVALDNALHVEWNDPHGTSIASQNERMP